MRKKVGELLEDAYPSDSVIFQSQARMNFGLARHDPITLLAIHDQGTGRKWGHQKPEFEALKRSALILAVTAWESFVEDTVTEQLDELLKRTSDPAAIPSIFNSIAHEWLDQARSGIRKPPDLILTGTGRRPAIQCALVYSLIQSDTFCSEGRFVRWILRPR